MDMRTPIVGILTLLALAPYAQAERLPLPLALPEGVKQCELQGWAYSNGLAPIVMRQSADQDSAPLGIVPVDDLSKTASHGNTLYPAVMVIAQYDKGWMKAAVVTDQENLEAARATPPAPGWIPANAIRFNIQASQGHEAPDRASKVLIELKGEWASEVGEIEQVHACQDDWVLVDYRQTLTRGADDALVPLPAEQQFRRQAWFRDTCGDLFTTCDRGSAQIPQ